MHSQHVTTEATGAKSKAPVLRGRWLVLGRVGWSALALLNLVIFAAALPSRSRSSSVRPCVSSA